jgi:hypothetical protein
MISNTTQDLDFTTNTSWFDISASRYYKFRGYFSPYISGHIVSIRFSKKKSWILFFRKPLRSDISSNICLDFDTNYFSIDASDNLTLNDFWKKDVSNNLVFTSGKIGIGLTNPDTNFKLDVLENRNCSEIYRNGTPLSSTLSIFLPLSRGSLTGTLSGNIGNIYDS